MLLYHFANLRLAPGSIIEPGNFGRLLSRYVPGTPGFGNPWLLARELVFEQLRPAGKPSRLVACFACTTREDADKYRQFNDANFLQVLHEVEATDAAAARHVGGLSYLDMSDGLAFLEAVRAAAAGYWSGSAGVEAKGNECVINSALRVVRAVE